MLIRPRIYYRVSNIFLIKKYVQFRYDRHILNRISVFLKSVFIIIFTYSPASAELYRVPPIDNRLSCGGSIVDIRTLCSFGEMPDPEYPFCGMQIITISNNKNITNIIYNYTDMKNVETEQSFIDGVQCLNISGNFFIMTENTDFGNCDICTWFDLFDFKGNYIGSTPGIYHKLNFPENKLDDKMTEKIKNGDFTISELSIFRPVK